MNLSCRIFEFFPLSQDIGDQNSDQCVHSKITYQFSVFFSSADRYLGVSKVLGYSLSDVLKDGLAMFFFSKYSLGHSQY